MIMGNATRTILLLVVSNCFMLSAWYAHLRFWNGRAWYVAAFLSWCIAFFEYSVHIPANRIGFSVFTLPQLQVIQIGLSLCLFVPFSVFIMKCPVKLEFLWAGICLMAAAAFIFKGIS